MSEYVHIVCLDAPSPPDYGGVFDLYYKIPALANLGKKIILHYFHYKGGRGHEGLESYCEEVNVYPRSVFLKSLLMLKPYIVSSRMEPDLIHRLNRDDYPVILEGIHCTGLLPHLHKRKVVVRVHNNEAVYYRQLLENESNIFRSLYFLYESSLLFRHQKKLSEEASYVFVSETDKEIFKEEYQLPKQFFLPCFVPWQEVRSLTGKGNYCLYHGNLSISENKAAALWLAETIFPQIDFSLVIAGKNADNLKNEFPEKVRIVNDPGDEELSELIQHAHINVLPSFNSTGVKLKLIHALFEGRFCLTNHAGANGSGLEQLVITAASNEEWIQAIHEIISKEFTSELLMQRHQILDIYNNQLNAEKLNALL